MEHIKNPTQGCSARYVCPSAQVIHSWGTMCYSPQLKFILNVRSIISLWNRWRQNFTVTSTNFHSDYSSNFSWAQWPEYFLSGPSNWEAAEQLKNATVSMDFDYELNL